jgi:hypothetical protein
MKKIILNLVLTVFTSSQALAYAPSVENREITKAVDEISKMLDGQGSITKTTKSRPMSPRKFKRNKKKFIKQTLKKIKLIENLNLIEQEEYLVIQNKKDFSKARKVSLKLLKKDRLLNKLAKKTGVRVEQIKNQLRKATSLESEDATKESLILKAQNAGGYQYVLEERLEKLMNMDYKSYLEGLKKLTRNKRSPASTKSLFNGEWDSFVAAALFVSGIILMMFATAILLVVMAIILLAGGSVASLVAPAAIGTGLSLIFLIATKS